MSKTGTNLLRLKQNKKYKLDISSPVNILNFIDSYILQFSFVLYSAQSPAVTVKDSGPLTANLQMESQVLDVTRELNLQLQQTATSDRVLTG